MDLEFVETVDALMVKERWQQTLPPGLRLITAEEVAVSSPSLAQQLRTSRWRFVLSGSELLSQSESVDWSQAIAALLRQNELIWEDTDKKGRPRRRDLRDLLQDLRLLEQHEPCSEEISSRAELELIAAVDSQGRSLKPAQLQFWLSQYLGFDLTLSRVRRVELTLLQC